MSIALPAVLIFLFLLPGFIFFHSLSRNENEKFKFKPFSSEFLFVLFYSSIFILVPLWIYYRCYLYFFPERIIDFQRYGVVLINLFTDAENLVNDQLMTFPLEKFLIVYFFVCIISYGFGKLTNKKVSFARFRFNSSWVEVFLNNEKTDFIVIEAVVGLADKTTYLYKGILSNFYLTEKGDLDLLHIKFAEKALIYQSDNADQCYIRDFSPIKGDVFILKNSTIRTLNITYERLKGVGKSHYSSLYF